MIEQKINEFFGDAESTGFGTGWWSGILSAFFGFLSFGGVLCLHFPQLLTSPELRPHYPMHTMRVLIQCLIVAAILFGVISSILRKKKILALTGMLLAIAATALGGSSVQINEYFAQWACHRPGLVFAGFVFDGAHLRAAGKTLAAVSRARNIQERVDFGRGLFHVHSSPDADFIFSGFVARYPGHEISGCSGSSTIYRSNAMDFAVFFGRRGCRPGRIFHSSGFA